MVTAAHPGLEPGTSELTARRSAIELAGNYESPLKSRWGDEEAFRQGSDTLSGVV